MLFLILFFSYSSYGISAIAPYGKLGFIFLGLVVVYKGCIENFVTLKTLYSDRIFVLFVSGLIGLASLNGVNALLLSIDGLTLHGETPLDKVYQQPVLYFVLLLVVIGLCVILARARSPFQNIIDAAVTFGYVVSAIGLVQIIYLYTGLAIFGGVIDVFYALGLTPSREMLVLTSRVTSVGSEPASLGQIIPGFLLPVYLYKFSIRKLKMHEYIQLSILALISYLSFSSSVIFGWVFVLLIMAFVSKRVSLGRKVIIVLIFLGILGLLLSVVSSLNPELILKVGNLENQSTSHRYSTLVNDFYVFLKYPILGIGNGSQGFLYNDNIYGTIFHNLNASETTNLLQGESGVINGGAFLPAFISGYGLVGVLFLFVVVNILNRLANESDFETKGFKVFWVTCSLHFLLSSVVTQDIHGNMIAIMSIFSPFFLHVNRRWGHRISSYV